VCSYIDQLTIIHPRVTLTPAIGLVNEASILRVYDRPL
jgi:hypothetical protein